MATLELLFDCAVPLTGLLVLWYLHRSRRAERASEKAGAYLGRENNELKAALDQQAHLLAHLERCNYHLACELYGKERVDRQLREAASRGSN